MSVYVDYLMEWPRTKAWPYGEACHLMADTLDELHAFAAAIGMRRAWFQGPPKHRFPHYDLTAKRRLVAVAAGAIDMPATMDDTEILATMRRLRGAYRAGQ